MQDDGTLKANAESLAVRPIDPLLASVLERCRALSGTSLDSDTRLFDAGLDSLDIAELLVNIEDTFEVMIPDELIGLELFETPGQLWAAISKLQGAGLD